MLSLFLSSPPPTPPPGGVRDFSRTPPGGGCVFPGRGRETGKPHVVALAVFALIRRWRDTFPLKGEGCYARCDASGGASEQRRSRLLAPRLGGGVRLRGAVWLSRSPLHPVCRFAQDDTEGSRSVGRKTKCRIS